LRSEAAAIGGIQGPLRVATSRWPAVGSGSGSTRPRPVSDDTETPFVKRPFAACGKLRSILDELADTQGVRNYDGTRWPRFFTTFRLHSKTEMSLSSISRATFAVEAVILAALALEALTLFMRSVSNLIAGALFAAYFLLMLVASISLLLMAIGAFDARSVQTGDRWRTMVWMGLAGSLMASVVFALAAYFSKPDEGNLSIVAVHYVFGPFLFFWVPLGHVWIERRRGRTSNGSSDPR
jgi:hypothetical protein